MLKDLLDVNAKKAFLLANEAIARAVLEKDVKVAAFYPGSPTSEILDTVYALSGAFPDLKMEIASNEKVALETAAGASMAGVRAFTSMKSVGLNVACDTFFSLGYTGVNAGLVVLVADDPHAHSSQSEQDGRFFGEAGHVPMLEPCTAQEAYDMVKWAFDLSEKYKIVVVIRTTTRVNHQSGIVTIGDVKRTPFEKKKWDKKCYCTLTGRARKLKGEALEKLMQIESDFEKSPFNKVYEGEGRYGIITSGISYLYVREAVDILGITPHIFKVGTVYPLPIQTLSAFLKRVDQVVIVEELLPYLELRVTAVAKDAHPAVTVHGKYTNDFSYIGEYTVPAVVKGIASALTIVPPDFDKYVKRAESLKAVLPNRFPTFCPGCPHRGTFYALQQALKNTEYVYNNDIGCYTMILLEPFTMGDTFMDMGASIGLSCGMQHVLTDTIICMVGDSTFFHAGLPALVNAVHNNHTFTLIILDNSVTAMTGQQPNPGSDFGVGAVKKIDIEQVVRGIGVTEVVTINAFDPVTNVEKIQKALAYKGVSVIISKGPCALYYDRLKRKRGEPLSPNTVDPKKCKTIYACMRDFYCPAIEMDMKTRKSRIITDLCNGCNVCALLCPADAIGGANV